MLKDMEKLYCYFELRAVGCTRWTYLNWFLAHLFRPWSNLWIKCWNWEVLQFRFHLVRLYWVLRYRYWLLQVYRHQGELQAIWLGGDLLEEDYTIVLDDKSGLLLVYRTGYTEIPCTVTVCEIMIQNVQDPNHSHHMLRIHTPTVHAGKSIYLLGNCSGQLT